MLGESRVLCDKKLVFASLKRRTPSLGHQCVTLLRQPYLKLLKMSLFLFWHLFYNCLFRNTLPDSWKIYRIYPIFKSGDKTDSTNYRPISILCAASKLFEFALHAVLSSSVKTALLRNEHEFITWRSTTTHFAGFKTHACKAVTDRGQIDADYCDLSKAFDLVAHPLWIKKLLVCGGDAPLVAFLGTYLLNRCCYVIVNGRTDIKNSPTSGIPKGSVLGPLVFSVSLTTYPPL